MQGTLSIFIFLMFVGLNRGVSAERTCNDSFICGDETIEILLIAVVIAICVIVLVQCIVIACLGYKINKVQKRMGSMNLSSGLRTYHTTNPGISSKESALEETEDITYMPYRARRFTGTFPADPNGRRLSEPRDQNLNRFTIIDGNEAQKEIWGLY